ncbi:unnamed protein product [Heligmosomoides polygyrus]|uniref:N-acetyltransferase domain-containing protein n=1 Tax=Heligmosomoides polygyrus TaxID=6339 RepID=A0A183FEJ0_HELPZ|nr:unnamed protein product [Heligmosomoides polygyrus]
MLWLLPDMLVAEHVMSVGKKQVGECRLDNTINTLKRCLQFATGDGSPSNCHFLERNPSSSCSWSRDEHVLVGEESRGAESFTLVGFEDENQIDGIMRFITKDLSEPYSIYTYRCFIHNWPELCVLAFDISSESDIAVVCKLDRNAEGCRKRYLMMLAVDESYRKLQLGTQQVHRAIEGMQAKRCDEVVLETEVSVNPGFIREKRLVRYYLNGGDAFRPKLYFSPPVATVRKSSCI